MRISLSVTEYSWPGGPERIGGALRRIAQLADEGGLDTLWLADHLIQGHPARPPDDEMLETYTTLGFLAAATERIRLGALVSAVTHRAPALLIKAVTTLDVLSGGRAWLGIGAGYHADEARMMGLSLPPVSERFVRLEETLQLASQMFSGDDSPVDGRCYQLERPVNSPAPVTRPRPPILIGGTGEKKTLRLVAQYADACNLFDIPNGGESVRRQLRVLREHCEQVGRPYHEIIRTLSTRLAPGESAEDFLRRCEALGALGIEHVVVLTDGPWTDDGVATLARTAARLTR